MSHSEFVIAKRLTEAENLLNNFQDLPLEYDILQGVIEIIKLLKKEEHAPTLQIRVFKVWIQILNCLKQIEDKSNLAYSDPNLFQILPFLSLSYKNVKIVLAFLGIVL